MMIAVLIIGGIILLFAVTALRGAPYVPTHLSSVRYLFDELMPLSSEDVVVDIGSGDGVVLREAAKRGARALGYEINPLLVGVSWLLSYRYRAQIRTQLADFWMVSFPPDVTIVYTFGESRDIQKMYRKVQAEATRLNKSLRFVSYGFTVESAEPLLQSRALTVYLVTPLHQ